jgi:hypothetical protein
MKDAENYYYSNGGGCASLDGKAIATNFAIDVASRQVFRRWKLLFDSWSANGRDL